MSYTVKPFSGKKYHDNQAHCGDDESPCAICGKPVIELKAKHWAVVVGGGATWGEWGADKGESGYIDEHDSGYMGAYPIGNDCHRRYST